MSVRRFIVSFAAIILSAAITGCGTSGSGVAAEEKRIVPLFEALTASAAGSVIINIDPDVAGASSIELTVSGDDNLISEVETFVVDGALEVRARHGQNLDPALPLRVVATVPDLSAVDASGTADVKVNGIDNGAFALEAKDSADVQLSGITTTLSIHSAGSADVGARGLEAMDVIIDSADTSDIDTCAHRSLIVSATGSSDITYFCSPVTVQKSVRDSADIHVGE